MPVAPELLEGVSLFRSLDAADRLALAAAMDGQKVPAGQVVFSVGDAGDTLICVVRGGVQVLVQDNAGQEIVLATAGPGESLGEMSLLDGRPRSATVRAVEDTEVLELARDDFLAVIRRQPDLALDIMTQMSARARGVDDLLRSRVSRNPNAEAAENLTAFERASDLIAAFSGSMPFLLVNAAWFAGWIIVNTVDLGLPRFDPYPFGLLTMIVSLEAIFLSCFVLISQSRLAAKDRVRADIEYDVNVKAELEVANLHEKLDRLHELVVQRLPRHG